MKFLPSVVPAAFVVVATLALPSSASAQCDPQWRFLGAGPLDGRVRFAYAFDTWRHALVIFGGHGTPGTLSDTWLWGGSSWSSGPSATPGQRMDSAMAFDSARGVAVLFGGYDPELGNQSDTWEFNGAAWTRRTVTGPPARSRHAMAYDAARARVVLFGGQTDASTGGVADTWEFDGVAWTMAATSGPSPRYSSALAYDGSRHVSVLYGGRDNVVCGCQTSDTWEWDGQAWTERSVSGPGQRVRHAMTFDGARSRIVLFGGQEFDFTLGDTWEYDGEQWQERLGDGPPPRYYHGMVFDTARREVLLFGGFEPSCPCDSNSLWSLSCCYANCDGSTQPPVLNVLDFSCFLQRFAAGDAYANCDNSMQPPVLNVLDFSCFLQRFAAGCP